jgi:hypothetical protein
MHPSRNGDYVLYADAEQELERLWEIVREYREKHDLCSKFVDDGLCRCSTCRKADEALASYVKWREMK